MPVWNIESDYAYLNHLNLNQLTFEFLRRNVSYQEDYNDYCNRLQRLSDRYGIYAVNDKAWKSDKDYWYFDPPIGDTESFTDWMIAQALEGREHHKIYIKWFIQQKWGITSEPQNPASPADGNIRFHSQDRYPREVNWHEIARYFDFDIYESESNYPSDFAGPYEQKHRYSVMVFDTYAPVLPQIERAKANLNNKKRRNINELGLDILPNPRQPNSGRDRLTLLLRIHDGSQCADHASISRVFFPHLGTGIENGQAGEKHVSELLSEANQYIERKYIHIPLYNLV